MLVPARASGGIGRRAGFRFQYSRVWGFKSPLAHHTHGSQSGVFLMSRGFRQRLNLSASDRARRLRRRSCSNELPSPRRDHRRHHTLPSGSRSGSCIRSIHSQITHDFVCVFTRDVWYDQADSLAASNSGPEHKMKGPNRDPNRYRLNTTRGRRGNHNLLY